LDPNHQEYKKYRAAFVHHGIDGIGLSVVDDDDLKVSE
jgi:hypothetical protein